MFKELEPKHYRKGLLYISPTIAIFSLFAVLMFMQYKDNELSFIRITFLYSLMIIAIFFFYFVFLKDFYRKTEAYQQKQNLKKNHELIERFNKQREELFNQSVTLLDKNESLIKELDNNEISELYQKYKGKSLLVIRSHENYLNEIKHLEKILLEGLPLINGLDTSYFLKVKEDYLIRLKQYLEGEIINLENAMKQIEEKNQINMIGMEIELKNKLDNLFTKK